MAMRFNPAPGWPPPPEGFTPDPGWRPDPSWPLAPPGWQLWVPDDQDAPATGGLTPGPVGYGQAPGAARLAQAPPWGSPPSSSGTDGLAIAGFVLGLLGLGGIGAILGIVFGIISLRRIRRTFRQGKGMAIAGIALGGCWLVLITLVIAFGLVGSGNPSPTPPGSASNVPGSHNVDPFTLKTGDCFDNPPATPGKVQHVLSVVQTPCTQPHNAQIFAIFSVGGAQDSYPGEPKLHSLADSGCSARAPASLDTAKLTQSMTIRFLYPLPFTWLAGVRTISCIVYNPTPTLTSSVLKS